MSIKGHLRESATRALLGARTTSLALFSLVANIAAAYLTFLLAKRLLSGIPLARGFRPGLAALAGVVAFWFFLHNPLRQMPRLATYVLAGVVFPVAAFYLTYDHAPLPRTWEQYRFWVSLGGGAVGLILATAVQGFVVKWRDRSTPPPPEPRGAIRRS